MPRTPSSDVRGIVLPRLMLVPDLAAALGVSDRTVRKLLSSQVLPGTKVAGKWVASREAVVDAIERGLKPTLRIATSTRHAGRAPDCRQRNRAERDEGRP